MNDDESSRTDPRVSRRGLFRGLAAGGIAVGGGAVGALAFGGGSSYKKATLSLDVACLFNLWREGTKSNPADDGDFRAPFLVEGWIYPAGHIKGDGFIPTQDGSIGRWFCRGYSLGDSSRPEPHTSSHQDFYFGTITKERLFPPDMLSSVGLEGSFDKSQICPRALVGGTGKYLGATGQLFERFIGTNTTKFPNTDDAGPNFRFDFDLRVLD